MVSGISNGKQALQDECLVVPPGEGRAVEIGGETIQFKAVGAQTGGRYAFMAGTLAPRTSGPPLHSHRKEDEIFYIVDGALLFQLGERFVKAEAGSFVYCPKDSAHTFCNPYGSPARIVGFMTPAGFEGYFQEFSDYLNSRKPGDPFDPAVVRAIGEKYESDVLGPPIPLTSAV